MVPCWWILKTTACGPDARRRWRLLRAVPVGASSGAHGASRWTETAPTSPVRWERGFGNMGPLLARHGFIVESFRLHFLTIGECVLSIPHTLGLPAQISAI